MPSVERRLLLVPNRSLLGSSERSDCSSIPVNSNNDKKLSLLKKKKSLQQELQQQQQQQEQQKSRRNDDKKKKVVTFNKSVRQRRITLASDYPIEIREKLWYTPNESKMLRKDAVTIVKLMMKNKTLPDNECTRGLEYKIPKKNKIRQERKQSIYWKVLSEQEDLLWSKEEYEEYSNDEEEEEEKMINLIVPQHEIEEQLAVIYRHESKKCKLEALVRGKKDAEEVVRIWKDTRTSI